MQKNSVTDQARERETIMLILSKALVRKSLQYVEKNSRTKLINSNCTEIVKKQLQEKNQLRKL